MTATTPTIELRDEQERWKNHLQTAKPITNLSTFVLGVKQQNVLKCCCRCENVESMTSEDYLQPVVGCTKYLRCFCIQNAPPSEGPDQVLQCKDVKEDHLVIQQIESLKLAVTETNAELLKALNEGGRSWNLCGMDEKKLQTSNMQSVEWFVASTFP